MTKLKHEQARRLARANGAHYGQHYRKARAAAGFLLPDPTACLAKAIDHAGIATAFREDFSAGWHEEAAL